jgi:hypothetical protein
VSSVAYAGHRLVTGAEDLGLATAAPTQGPVYGLGIISCHGALALAADVLALAAPSAQREQPVDRQPSAGRTVARC